MNDFKTEKSKGFSWFLVVKIMQLNDESIILEQFLKLLAVL